VIGPTQRTLTTYNTHTRQKYKLPARFQPAISAGERQQTQALDGTAIGITERS